MPAVADINTTMIEEARNGTATAWDALFRRYQLPLFSYVMELVRNEQESLDIIQETFINAVRHIGNLHDDAKFGSWLFGIAHQKCIQLWRKSARRQQVIDDRELEIDGGDALQDEAGPSELLLRKEQEETFYRALAKLGETHRAVILLHFLEDFSLEEIAGITEASLGTVKSRMHYAKQHLRKALNEEAK